MRRDAELATLGWLVLRFGLQPTVGDPEGLWARSGVARARIAPSGAGTPG